MLALIATDGSTASLAAARWCDDHFPPTTQFAIAAVAPLRDDPMADAGGIEGPTSTPAAVDAENEELLHQAEIAAATTAQQLAPHPVEERVLRGEAGAALVALAEELDADVVVVGSNQRGILTRVFLGSVSDYVVHHSKRPVLVVPFVNGDEPDPDAK